jgi:hypothetical protein
LTVCIAAICNDGYSIVLAADRMITARGTEFEIPGLTRQSNRASILKTVPLNKHLIAMTSGDAGFQSDAMQHLFSRINPEGLLFATPTTHTSSSIHVRDAALLYLEFCDEQRRRATNSLLAPYGLDVGSFIAKQKSMNAEFVTSICTEVEDLRSQIGDPVLFCGIDGTGAHIVHCDGDRLSSADSFAFAAIGSGGEHAESQFMLGNHTRFASVPDTILLTYVAKKRSEVAQGVGEQTDMFVISASPNGFFYVMAEQLEKLDALYKTMEKDQSKAFDRAKVKVKNYVDQLVKAEADATEKASPAPEGNQKQITSEAEK